jgi:Ca2+-binding RTX toxin-like protein
MATKYGSDGYDTIDMSPYGDSDDWVFAYAGNDTVYGGEGNDHLYGGYNDDHLYGQGGNDYLIGGHNNDYLSGGADNDKLYGDSGSDTIYGGSGLDAINGGPGVDTMYGGSDADRFYFSSSHTGNYYAGYADTIKDFTEEDTIYLAGSFSQDSDGGALGAGEFRIKQHIDWNFWLVEFKTWEYPTAYHDIKVYGADPDGNILTY